MMKVRLGFKLQIMQRAKYGEASNFSPATGMYLEESTALLVDKGYSMETLTIILHLVLE